MLSVMPSRNQNVLFSGLEAPVLLTNAEALLPVLERVLPTWPFTVTPSSSDAGFCMSITGQDDGSFLCQSSDPLEKPKAWDMVNAICEMVVALAWAQIHANPSWLCLHCAAVEFNGRLVLFPNRRRSGKSTLTAVLAQRGHRVFTDDFLPVLIDKNGSMLGVANGITPRVRLPLPEGFSHDFGEWAKGCSLIANDQYSYLGIDRLAEHGATLPIGAVVILDRSDSEICPELQDIEAADLLDDLIVQNFARLAHSGRILSTSHAVSETATRHRLSFSSAQEAATFLEQKFRSWPEQVSSVPLHALPTQTVAQVSVLEEAHPTFDSSTIYQQAPGTIEVCTGDRRYVSDGHGIGIHRLNAGSGVIWTLLEEQCDLAEIVAILSEAFPDQPVANIQKDCVQTLQQFIQSYLIVPASSVEEKVG